MTTVADTDPEIRLADYQPPPWRVRHARLEFDLDPAATTVTATLALATTCPVIADAATV